MNDTGKYLNHPQPVSIAGNEYSLKGMSIAMITAEAANMVREQHLASPRRHADGMGLEGADRVSFLLQWMEKNPEPEGAVLEDLVIEYITNDAGMLSMVAYGLSDQLDISIDEAHDILVASDGEELFAAAQVLFGGLLKKAKKGATSGKKPRKRNR